MKKNKLLPILLLAGAGVVAYMYFKNKSAVKDLAKGIEVEPEESKEASTDQTTTTSEPVNTTEDNRPNGKKIETYVKSASEVVKNAKQFLKARKVRRAATQAKDASSMVRKKRMPKKSSKRVPRKQRNVVRGFDDLSVLY
jgi:hypothetical protein